MTKYIIGAFALLIIGGCAGSANHQVLSEYDAMDSSLDCGEIEVELFKAQAVIDDVQKDREDMTFSDITDGLLWFPFNLIAKSSNYKNATEAANKRIARLETIKSEQCKENPYEYEETENE